MNETYVELSLWDTELSEHTYRVADTVVQPASQKDLTEFCRRYHYSQRGRGASYPWVYGLWHGPTLLGIVGYNVPPESVRRSIFGAEHGGHVWHMGRLALADDAPHNCESRLIGGSLRLMRDDHPHVWAVITYADTSAGHIGYVYQATNAVYTGTSAVHPYFVDRAGHRHHPRGNRREITQLEASQRGWERHAGSAKHRYVYILGNKTDRRTRRELLLYPSLPYPKMEPPTSPPG